MTDSPPTSSVRVWDLPTRVFHWLLVLCLVGLVITGEMEDAALEWHARLGYTVLTLVLFRLVWGWIGGHWSRFASFVPSWRAVRTYVQAARAGQHVPSVGHNPLGAISVLCILLFLLLQVGSGLVSDDEVTFTGPLAAQVSSSFSLFATWYHKEVGKAVLMALAALHVLAIAYHHWKHRDDLVTPMLRGDKPLHPDVPASRDGWVQRLVALCVVATCAGAVRMLVNWNG